jgi:hypothetical protein
MSTAGPGAGGVPGPGPGGAGGAPGPGPGGAGGAPRPGASGAGGAPGPGVGGAGAGGPPPQPQPVIFALSPARASNVLLDYTSPVDIKQYYKSVAGLEPKSTYPPVGCWDLFVRSNTEPGLQTGR